MNQGGGTAGGASPARGGASEHHERRLERLIDRLPERLQKAIRWLRRPGLRWLRLVAGILFIAGSFLSILPIFGIWMLPVGVVLLAEDIPAFRRLRDWLLDWIGRHRPHWLAAHHTPQVFNEGEEEVVKSFTDREYSRAHRGPLDWQTRVGPPVGTSAASAKICPDDGHALPGRTRRNLPHGSVFPMISKGATQ
jgi:hypothetical protein